MQVSRNRCPGGCTVFVDVAQGAMRSSRSAAASLEYSGRTTPRCAPPGTPRWRTCRPAGAPVATRGALLLLAALSASLDAAAAETTTLELSAPEPAEARYSQAMTFTAQLGRASTGAGVAGAACSPVCSLIVRVGPTDTPDVSFTLNAQGIPVSADGTVSFRVPFVDGAFDDARFIAAPTGTRYTVQARFAGTGTGALDDPSCGPEAHPEGDLCASSSSVELTLLSETASIALGAGRSGALGDTIDLSAVLADPNGNAAADGMLVDGQGSLELVGRTVDFFYDQNNNGDPEAAELIGSAPTNASGVAALPFTLDPQYVRAGTYAAGIHAQFAGDGQYGVARASGELVVLPAALDIGRSLVEADPSELPANGAARATIRVRLVDAFNNPLDENSPPHDVEIEADAGRFLDDVTQDPENGTYVRTFQASTIPGDVTVTTTIDGQPGPSVTVTLTGERGGCQCSATDDGPALGGLGALLMGARLVRRRRAGGGA